MKESAPVMGIIDFEVGSLERINRKKDNFREAISAGKTREEKLRLGVEHVLGHLLEGSNGEKVSAGRLFGEVREMFFIACGAKEKGMVDAAFKTLSSRSQCLSLSKRLNLEDKVKFYSAETADKLDLGELFQDNLSFQERLGYTLNQLPQTKKLILESDEPVQFSKLDQCERGLVGFLQLTKRPTVIKWTNSSDEEGVAIFCSKRKLSPVVFESTPECIAEEAIYATRAGDVRRNPSLVGAAIGTMIRKLHLAGVAYDNRFLDHVFIKMVSARGRISTRIIDLEFAKLSRDEKDFKKDIKNAEGELTRFYQGDKAALKTVLASFNDYYYA